MREESCQPPADTNWEEAQLVEVALAAEEGIPGAVKELQRREKDADIITVKTVNKSVITQAPKDDLQFDTVDLTGSIKEFLSDITIEWKN
jgi:hypothetical protein